jgi:hypothetical protein
LAAAHNLFVIDPDIEFASDDIDVGCGIPLCAGVGAVRVSEGYVDAGVFFILQYFADYIFQFDVGAYRELAYPVTVFVGVSVGPEIVF